MVDVVSATFQFAAILCGERFVALFLPAVPAPDLVNHVSALDRQTMRLNSGRQSGRKRGDEALRRKGSRAN